MELPQFSSTFPLNSFATCDGATGVNRTQILPIHSTCVLCSLTCFGCSAEFLFSADFLSSSTSWCLLSSAAFLARIRAMRESMDSSLTEDMATREVKRTQRTRDQGQGK